MYRGLISLRGCESRRQLMKFMCPVCGFVGLEEDPNQSCHTYEICPCCFVEFGFDAFPDVPGNFEKMRNRWIQEGMPWGSRYTQAPEGWDGIKQLKDAGFGDLIQK